MELYVYVRKDTKKGDKVQKWGGKKKDKQAPLPEIKSGKALYIYK